MIEKEPFFILQLPVHPLTMEEALGIIIQQVEAEGAPFLVFTPNPELLMTAQGDEDLQQVLSSAHLFLPDGFGILLAARFLGYPLQERVTGMDLVQKLLHRAEALGFSFFFLGGRPGVVEKAVEKLKGTHPSLQVVGGHHGFFPRDQEEEIVGYINTKKPQILLVGMGAPRQEGFLYRNRERLSIQVGITVGGSLDVLSGELKRAPDWMIRCNIEWLFRLIQEPSRWRRMLALPKFLYLVLQERREKNP